MNCAVNFSAMNLLMNSNAEQAVLTGVKSGCEPLAYNEAITLRELLGHRGRRCWRQRVNQ